MPFVIADNDDFKIDTMIDRSMHKTTKNKLHIKEPTTVKARCWTKAVL